MPPRARAVGVDDGAYDGDALNESKRAIEKMRPLLSDSGTCFGGQVGFTTYVYEPHARLGARSMNRFSTSKRSRAEEDTDQRCPVLSIPNA